MLSLEPFNEEFQQYQDAVSSLTHEVIKKKNEQLEVLITQKLEAAGFTFPDQLTFHQFLKFRCNIRVFPDRRNELLVDGELICWWYDTVRFEEKDGVYTAILGEHPDQAHKSKAPH